MAFARHNQIWSVPGMTAWGYSLASYVYIILFLLLLLLSRAIARKWSWEVPRLEDVDLMRGIAPLLGPPGRERSAWKRALRVVLNAL